MKRILSCIVISTLMACSTNVSVVSHIPRPLVENLNLPLALYLNDAFLHASYEEKKEERLNLTVNLGSAHSLMVQTIFSALGDLTLLESESDPVPTGAIKITPEFIALQYSIPSENNANIYEAWLKYRFQFTNDQGSVIADWQINGYGKVASKNLQQRDTSLNMAIEIAMRDVGAQLAIGFPSQPAVQNWINHSQANNEG